MDTVIGIIQSYKTIQNVFILPKNWRKKYSSIV